MGESQISTVGGFLRELRTRKGLTQEMVADIVGVRTSNISSWEVGKTAFSPSRKSKIVQGYQMTKEEIREFSVLMDISGHKQRVQEGRGRPSARKSVYYPQGAEALYSLLSLPKSEREKVIRAAIAYDSASDQNGEAK